MTSRPAALSLALDPLRERSVAGRTCPESTLTASQRQGIVRAMTTCPKHPKTKLQCPACIASIRSEARAEASRENGKKHTAKIPVDKNASG